MKFLKFFIQEFSTIEILFFSVSIIVGLVFLSLSRLSFYIDCLEHYRVNAWRNMLIGLVAVLLPIFYIAIKISIRK